MVKLGKVHFHWILSLSISRFSRQHHWGAAAGANLFLRSWMSGWKNRDFLQKQPLWTLKESEASHLQLHLDSVHGQDFILERGNRKIKTELLNCLRVIQQLLLSPSINIACLHLTLTLFNESSRPSSGGLTPLTCSASVTSLCLCSSRENMCSLEERSLEFKDEKNNNNNTTLN